MPQSQRQRERRAEAIRVVGKMYGRYPVADIARVLKVDRRSVHRYAVELGLSGQGARIGSEERTG